MGAYVGRGGFGVMLRFWAVRGASLHPESVLHENYLTRTSMRRIMRDVNPRNPLEIAVR